MEDHTKNRGDVGKRNWVGGKEERRHIKKGIAKLAYQIGI